MVDTQFFMLIYLTWFGKNWNWGIFWPKSLRQILSIPPWGKKVCPLMSSVQGTYKASLLGWWGWLGQIMDGGLVGRKKSSQMLLEDPSSEGNYSPSSLIICWAKVPLSERWDPSRILLLFSPHFYSVPKNRLCMYIFHIIAFQTMNKKLWLSQDYISE